MFNYKHVLETIEMVEREHLDIRTVTMGISLLPCVRATGEATAQAVYDRVCKKAENIVRVTRELSGEYGIPIVNKRVSVTPVSLVCAAFPEKAPLIGRALDRAAQTLGIDFLGGYSALVHKGTARDIFKEHTRSIGKYGNALFFGQRRLFQVGHKYGRRKADGSGN